jgi:hypothetical protein
VRRSARPVRSAASASPTASPLPPRRDVMCLVVVVDSPACIFAARQHRTPAMSLHSPPASSAAFDALIQQMRPYIETMPSASGLWCLPVSRMTPHNGQERIRAAQWARRLCANDTDLQTRTTYAEALLSMLAARGPFACLSDTRPHHDHHHQPTFQLRSSHAGGLAAPFDALPPSSSLPRWSLPPPSPSHGRRSMDSMLMYTLNAHRRRTIMAPARNHHRLVLKRPFHLARLHSVATIHPSASPLPPHRSINDHRRSSAHTYTAIPGHR